MNAQTSLADVMLSENLSEYSLVRGYYIINLATKQKAGWSEGRRIIVCTSTELIEKIMKSLDEDEKNVRLKIGPLLVHKNGLFGFELWNSLTLNSVPIRITSEKEFEEASKLLIKPIWSEDWW